MFFSNVAVFLQIAHVLLQIGNRGRQLGRRQPLRAFDQSSTAVLIRTIVEHAIEAACWLPQSLLTARHALLHEFDAAYVFLRKRFHDVPCKASARRSPSAVALTSDPASGR